jgi:prepilin-type N-terminal cleavage/methylation domain-containing protein
MPISNGRATGPRAFVLLEIIMAMALFGILGVGLTEALDKTAENSLASRREVKMLRTLESLLTEASKALQFEEGEENLGENENGVYFQRVIEPLEAENMDGQALTQMWRVAIIASWKTKGGREMQEVAETIRYEPLYQNNR